MLDGVLDGLDGAEVERGLDGLGMPAEAVVDDVDRHDACAQHTAQDAVERCGDAARR